MIAIIRIKGQVGMDKDIIETFYRLRLRRKYACIVIDKPTPEQLGMLKKVENFVAFGELDKEGNLKPFFRLHPPIKGIESKKHFGVNKGVLGNNKDKINELVRRML